MTERPVGRTKDAGWEIGVSRTVARPIKQVWEFLTSTTGLALWLGQGVRRLDEPGTAYATDAGTEGEVRSLRPQDRVRLTWRPQDWDHDSTVQVAVSASAADRTTIRFHQERLVDAAQRERQRAHWQAVLDEVVAALAGR